MIKNDTLSISLSSEDKNPNFEKWLINLMEKGNYKFIERKYHHLKKRMITLMYFEFAGKGDSDFEEKKI